MKGTIESRRRVEADAEGQLSVVLAHPGEYAVAETDRAITVTEADVREDTELSLSV